MLLEEALRQIRAGSDVIGICTFEDNYPWCKELMDRIRADHPKSPSFAVAHW